MGATFICDKNQLMMEFVRMLDLELVQRHTHIGFWSKNTFKFRTSHSPLANALSLLYNYGLSFLKLVYHAQTKYYHFQNIYNHLDLQNPKPFKTLSEFLDRIQLTQQFKKSAEDIFINELNLDKEFVYDILAPIIADYYNQNILINGFAGFVVSTGFTCQPVQLKHGMN